MFTSRDGREGLFGEGHGPCLRVRALADVGKF